MDLIRLTSKQTKTVPVALPFDAPRMYRGTLEETIWWAIHGHSGAEELLILGHSYLVSMIVGRFIYHWPVTERFEEEMVAVGLLAVTQKIYDLDTMDTMDDWQWLPYKLMNSITYQIEKFLNENMTIVRASFATNRRRAADSAPLEMGESREITGVDGATYDTFETYIIDLAESMEHPFSYNSLTPVEQDRFNQLLEHARGNHGS